MPGKCDRCININLDEVEVIIDRYRNDKGALISILQDIQAKFNYLPKEALGLVKEKRKLPLSQVFAVAGFFTAFSLKPQGKNIIQVCMGTACHVRGSPQILEEFERQLGIKAGNSTEDFLFSLKCVNCLGACALGPVVVVNGKYHGNLLRSQVTDILHTYTQSGEKTPNQKEKKQ